MISFDGHKHVRVEDSGLKPPSVGEFLGASMRRRGLTAKLVSQRSGVSLSDLDAILADEIPLDRALSHKLERAFPKMGRLLLKLQSHRMFYERYGVPRPSSPIRRIALIRKLAA